MESEHGVTQGMSEWAAAQWLGRTVTIRLAGAQSLSGRLCHVSTRKAFLVDAAGDGSAVVSVPLASIAAIEPLTQDAA